MTYVEPFSSPARLLSGANFPLAHCPSLQYDIQHWFTSFIRQQVCFGAPSSSIVRGAPFRQFMAEISRQANEWQTDYLGSLIAEPRIIKFLTHVWSYWSYYRHFDHFALPRLAMLLNTGGAVCFFSLINCSYMAFD